MTRKLDCIIKCTRGSSCIVTRATTAMALHYYPAMLQSVWVLTTCVTHSTTYRESGYVPGFSTDTNKHTNYIQKG
jgi:hypothetical protein